MYIRNSIAPLSSSLTQQCFWWGFHFYLFSQLLWSLFYSLCSCISPHKPTLSNGNLREAALANLFSEGILFAKIQLYHIFEHFRGDTFQKIRIIKKKLGGLISISEVHKIRFINPNEAEIDIVKIAIALTLFILLILNLLIDILHNKTDIRLCTR